MADSETDLSLSPPDPDPIYSPAMQMVVSKFRDLISGTSDSILSAVYFHSIIEGMDKAKKDDVKSFLEQRMKHLQAMRSENGDSEVAKEFRNMAEAMIKSHGPPTEKHLALWIQAVTTGITETAKAQVN